MTGKNPNFLEIGQRLRKLGEAMSDLNQKESVETHGFHQPQYNNWERGIRRISIDEAIGLCDRYGLTLDFIYRGRADGLPETPKRVL